MTGFSVPLLLPLTGIIDITITRTVGGSYVKGGWVKGVPTTLTVKANVQPVLKGTDTLLVPEADRSKEMIKVYTTSPLLQRKEGASPNEGDRISYDGKTWEVMKVISYKMGVLDHFKSIAVRVELT